MKKIKYIVLLSLAVTLLFLAGCGGDDYQNTMTQGEGYTVITPEEAKKIMDEATGYVILDVRTLPEYNEGHIEGAILIPDYEIMERAERELPDKDQLILVYCRSGNRSKAAARDLVQLGYTNVMEFGGILDWPYEIVK